MAMNTQVVGLEGPSVSLHVHMCLQTHELSLWFYQNVYFGVDGGSKCTGLESEGQRVKWG
jgi:hypothetical protein